VARTAVRAVHITREGLHDQMLEDPDLADRLVQNLAKRLSVFAGELRRADAMLGGGRPMPQPIPLAAAATPQEAIENQSA
jgi:hypothetical protein